MKNENLVYGLAGLMELLHISKSTAYRIKRSGKLDNCCYQVGRIVAFDAEKVLETLRVDNNLPWQKC